MAIDKKDMNSRHAIAAFEKLGDYLNNIMNILEAAQKEIGK